jgi:hypothetical protein
VPSVLLVCVGLPLLLLHRAESQLGEASAATAAAIASMLEASRLAEIMEMTLS